MKQPVIEVISFLLVKGWNFSKQFPMNTPITVPNKLKMVCIRKVSNQKCPMTLDEEYALYEPIVMDLNKVEIRDELLVRYIKYIIVVCSSS